MTSTTIAPPAAGADSTDVAALLDAYDRDGFVLVERLMSARDLADARRGVEWAMTNQQGKYTWIKQRTYEWFREHPVFVRLIEHPTVLAFGRALLGDDDMHLIGAQCSRNTKADHYAPGVINIHQDTGLHPLPDRKVPGLPD